MKIIVNDNVVFDEFPIILWNDRGLLLGDGLFETIKSENGKLLFFEAHYKRFFESTVKLLIPFKFSLENLKKKCQQIVDINKLDGDIAIRMTLTRGRLEEGRGIGISETASPTLIITAASYHRPAIQPTVCITTIKRNEFSILTQIKTLNYLESILARQQAVSQGYNEGIMLNTKGAVTETSIGNIFVVINREVFTPKKADGILPGIIRQVIFNAIQEKGGKIIESTLYPEDLFSATEIFQTNSLLEIQSFSKINKHPLLTGTQAILTKQVLKHYRSYKNKN
ncbi:MAG: aminotransferase class IV [Coxiella-like endosymbiont]|uniref:aminotransferase class IV n=1 Tax=Coxiella-like endosymbiont TaxID=1592897 RepID=UPI00215AA709|nr:aminotransferase class IV [Coxiella-like endosymbiont]UVE59287.1 aminotransferase class IV [Coxiella-like endosymbiont]